MPCHRMQGGDAESWRAGGGVPPKGKAIDQLYVLCGLPVANIQVSRRVLEEGSLFFIPDPGSDPGPDPNLGPKGNT